MVQESDATSVGCCRDLGGEAPRLPGPGVDGHTEPVRGLAGGDARGLLRGTFLRVESDGDRAGGRVPGPRADPGRGAARLGERGPELGGFDGELAADLERERVVRGQASGRGPSGGCRGHGSPRRASRGGGAVGRPGAAGLWCCGAGVRWSGAMVRCGGVVLQCCGAGVLRCWGAAVRRDAVLRCTAPGSHRTAAVRPGPGSPSGTTVAGWVPGSFQCGYRRVSALKWLRRYRTALEWLG